MHFFDGIVWKNFSTWIGKMFLKIETKLVFLMSHDSKFQVVQRVVESLSFGQINVLYIGIRDSIENNFRCIFR